ncbi:MAG: hypothetical protein PHF74_05140 [Dehalococcoidales bacterium]|nr:hypothetical protein [Dehalococcoidales bacterium]
MNTARIWIFRALVLIGLGTFVYSFFQPWWIAETKSAVAGNHNVIIHPYGLDGGGLEGYFALLPGGGVEVAVPQFLIIVIWIFFGAAIAALLLGMIFNKASIPLFGKRLNISRWAVGLVGLVYIVVCVAAVLFAMPKIALLHIPFTGTAFVYVGSFGMWSIELDVTAYIPFGYWLAIGTGVYLVVLAFLRNKIIGKSAE